MSSIAREQENRTDLINWFISVGGVLADAYSIGFRVFDISTGLPGTQVFPAAPGTYEDVTSAPGRFAEGAYYAYNNAGAEGWTPDPAEPLGTHYIEWRWKLTALSAWQTGSEMFEVVASSSGSTVDTYITLSDVRDAGLLIADYPDDTVVAAIELWQAMLERICRQWFNPRTLTLRVDGTDSDTIHTGVPIISIEYVKLNNDTAELDTDYYKVYNGRSYPDDRRNPRIKLCSINEYADIFTAPISAGRMKFRKGRQNQEIKGVFGFVEENMLPPKPIQRALLKLVIEKLIRPVYTAPGTAPVTVPPLLAGLVVEEATDGHRVKYGETYKVAERRAVGFSGITQDPEIIDILRMYRAPLGVATPAHPSFG